MKQPKCLGCGHAQNRHIDGVGLCLVASCRLCLIFRSAEEDAENALLDGDEHRDEASE